MKQNHWHRWVGDMGAATVVVIADYFLVLTDCVIAGRILGEMALAALNLLMPVFSIVTFFLWLVASGTVGAYSTARAKGRATRAARIAGTGLAAAALTGGALLLALVVAKQPYFAFMEPGAALADLAGAYWTWYLPAVFLASVELMLFYLVYVNGGWLACIASYAVQTVVNLGASYGLCLGFGMAGLSLGSVFAYVAGLAVLLPRFCGRRDRIALTPAFRVVALVRSFRASFGDAFVWLLHAVIFLAIAKYVLVAWDPESLAVAAVVFCIIRLTAFFGGIGFVFRTMKTDDRFFERASALAFMALGLSTACFLIAPEPLVGLFGIEDLELSEGANMAARITVGGLFVSVVFVFLPLVRRARRSVLPQAAPNYLQQYVLGRMAEEPGSQMFNLVKLFRLRKGVDLERLASALVASARTHAAIRTVLRRDIDGDVLQRQELPESAVTCPVVRAEAASLLADKESLVTAFEPLGKRLYNACIYDCGDEAYLLSDFHHLICDGYSFPLILNGARTVYDGGTLENDCYYEVLEKRAARAVSPVAEAARGLWRQVLKAEKFVTLPPSDFAGPGGFGVYETALGLPPGFEAFLVTHRVTRHHVFLAATVLALARLTDANDVLVDWVFHGRVSKEELKTVGAFMVDLPLTVEDLGELTPADVLSRVKMSTFNGIKSVGAIRSVEDVNPDGRERLTFIYQDEWGELMSSGPVREDGPYGWMIDETIPLVPPAAQPENPFNVEIMEHRESTRLFLEYDSGRYAEATVRRYADLFRSALDTLCRRENA